MTSKERVMAAISHVEPDRVPIGELEIDAPIVEQVLGRPTFYGSRLPLLKAYWEGRRDEVVDSMKRDYVEFIRKTGFDIAEVRLVPDKDARFIPMNQISETDFGDENGNVLKWSPETLEIMLVKRGHGPLQLVEQGEAGETAGRREPTESELEFARHVVDELGDTHFIVGPVADSIGKPAVECGWPQSMAAPYRDPAWFSEILNVLMEDPDKLHEQTLAEAARTADAAAWWRAFGCDAIWTAFDYGHNKNTFMSPQSFEAFLYPGLRALSEGVRRSGSPHIFHSCGNNRLIWDKFVEAGVDVYQSIQDEEPLEDLKKQCGQDLALWGGVSARLLETGTRDEIRGQVEHALDVAARGGGYIMGSSHSLGPGVKYDNFMTVLEVLHKKG